MLANQEFPECHERYGQQATEDTEQTCARQDRDDDGDGHDACSGGTVVDGCRGSGLRGDGEVRGRLTWGSAIAKH